MAWEVLVCGYRRRRETEAGRQSSMRREATGKTVDATKKRRCDAQVLGFGA